MSPPETDLWMKELLPVYEKAMHELLRHVSVQCVERGALMANVWTAISSILGSHVHLQDRKMTDLISANLRQKKRLMDLEREYDTLRSESYEISRPLRELREKMAAVEAQNEELGDTVDDKMRVIRGLGDNLEGLNAGITLFLPHFFDYNGNLHLRSLLDKEKVPLQDAHQALELEQSGINLIRDLARLMRHVMLAHEDLHQKYQSGEPDFKEKLITITDEILGLKVEKLFKDHMDSVKENGETKAKLLEVSQDLTRSKNAVTDMQTRLETLEEENENLANDLEEKEDALEALSEQFVNQQAQSAGEDKNLYPNCRCRPACKCQEDKEAESVASKNPFKKAASAKKKVSCIPTPFHSLLTTSDSRALIPLAKFPDTVHIIPLRVLNRTILQMLEDMVHFYEGTTRPPLHEFLYEFMLRKYGLVGLAEKYLVDFLASLQKHNKQSKQVESFAKFCGLGKSLPEEALARVLQVYSCIQYTAANWADKAIAKESHANKSNQGRELYSFERTCAGLKRAFSHAPQATITRMLAEVEAQATQGGGNKYRQVDWDVVVDQVLKEWHVESATLKEELQRLFEEGDDNNDGILSLDEFQAIVHRVNPRIKLAEILKLFREAMQLSGGSSIAPEDFATVMTKNEVLRASLEVKKGFRRNSTLPLPMSFGNDEASGEGESHAHENEVSEQLAIIDDTWRSSEKIVQANLMDLKAAGHPQALSLSEDLNRLQSLMKQRVDVDIEQYWVEYRSFMSSISKAMEQIKSDRKD